MKQAFTLAEIMITLAVIGIISAIIMPIALNNVPDENIMKFKKANATLYQVIQELVNSDEYYKDGDLGKYPDGSYIADGSYFCNTFVNTLSTKSNKCDELKDAFINGKHNLEEDKIDEYIDEYCKSASKKVKDQIITSDGIIYYETSPGYTFSGNYHDEDGNVKWDKDTTHPDDVVSLNFQDKYGNNLKGKYSFMYVTWDKIGGSGSEHYNNNNAPFLYIYKPICIDVDGIPNEGSENCDDIKDICPFGYGIRVDGKILPGKRASDWLEKSIQGEN